MGKKLICVTKCYHGKLWQAGEQTTDDVLERVGPVPKHFKGVGTDEAKSAVVDADGSGYANMSEMRNYLKAKGVDVKAKATRAELQEQIDQLQEDPLA